jgi:hypothetical protein
MCYKLSYFFNQKIEPMKTKRTLKLSTFLLAFSALFFSYFGSSLWAEAGGSWTTCYSTFRIAGSGCTFEVTDCGTCAIKTCYEYKDSGRCKSDTWIYDPPTNN